MTTESLSPASRIVIETSSRPPGERSTSISRIGGVEGAGPAASALARGAAPACPARAVERASWTAAPAANVFGSEGRPSVALPLDSVGAWTAAEVATPRDRRRRRDVGLSQAARGLVYGRPRGAHAICWGCASARDGWRGRRRVCNRRKDVGRDFHWHGFGRRKAGSTVAFAAEIAWGGKDGGG